MKVLLVEDDDAIAVPLVKGLEREGFSLLRVGTAASALHADRVDLVLLDLGLPDGDGLDVCRRLRAVYDVPIIVISARGEEVDRIVGLEVGADDYLVKPFGLRELVARIRAVCRRTSRVPDQVTESASAPVAARPTGAGATGANTGPDVFVHGALEVDARRRRVFVDGEEIGLTRKEFDVLQLLTRDPGAIRTRDEIFEQVWDLHWYGPTKTLDVHVASLRKKLGDAGLIETVRGVGFRLGPVPEGQAEA